MNLSHWSEASHLQRIESRAQENQARSCFDKPRGFWVSVDGDDDWLSWATANEFGIGPYRHRVHLATGANLLVIDTHLKLIDFRIRYGRDETRYPASIRLGKYIAWDGVAAKYQGIIIAPYCWEARMSESFYYGWDCASGCIWDATAISRVELVREAA